jgi:hypothetical protein
VSSCFPNGSHSSSAANRPDCRADFLARCTHVVTVPQFGAVGSLNVAVASSLAMFEMVRGKRPTVEIVGDSYKTSNAGLP